MRSWSGPRYETSLQLSRGGVSRDSKRKKVKVCFIYSAVSSSFDHSKRFTLHLLHGRPVHSDTNSTYVGSIVATQQLRAKTIHSHFHNCIVSSQVLYMDTAEQTVGRRGKNENAQTSKGRFGTWALPIAYR